MKSRIWTVASGILLNAALTTTLWAGDAPFSARRSVDGAVDGAKDVHSADVDGDGDLDIVGLAATADQVAWWENTAGDGTLWTKRPVAGGFIGARSVHAADVDGDGDVDIVGGGAFEVVWFENVAGDGSIWAKNRLPGGLGLRVVLAADIDGDGDVDVVDISLNSSRLFWHENVAGDGSLWNTHLTGLNTASTLDSADMDGDGDVDILSGGGWEENLSGDGTLWVTRAVDSSARDTRAADVDGDGDIDVVGSLRLPGSTQQVAWWENVAGDATLWNAHGISAPFGAGFASVRAEDVDGDGKIDIVAALPSNEVAWFENAAGDGTLWNEHTVDGAFDQNPSVHAADLDGDGDADILGATIVADEIAWWENKTIHRNAVFPPTEHIGGQLLRRGNLRRCTADVDGDGDARHARGRPWPNNQHRLVGEHGERWLFLDRAHRGWQRSLAVFRRATAADVDGDGDMDIVGSAKWPRLTSCGGRTRRGDGVGLRPKHTVGGSELYLARPFRSISTGTAMWTAIGDLDVLGFLNCGSHHVVSECSAGDGIRSGYGTHRRLVPSSRLPDRCKQRIWMETAISDILGAAFEIRRHRVVGEHIWRWIRVVRAHTVDSSFGIRPHHAVCGVDVDRRRRPRHRRRWARTAGVALV